MSFLTVHASTNPISRLHSTRTRPFYYSWPAMGGCRKSLWWRKDEVFSTHRSKAGAIEMPTRRMTLARNELDLAT